MSKKINKKLNKKSSIKIKKERFMPFELGNINPDRGRILMLIISIIFVTTAMTMSQAIQKKEILKDVVPTVVKAKPTALAKEITEMVAGYPIEKMTSYIVEQDPETAKFLIAIAKKESAWGKRKPILNGEDCYNYWGFRLKAERMGSGGHTCFDSPKQAVEVVGARIAQLVEEEKINTPEKMVIWKCGYACNGPEAAGSEKWIKDVSYYYDKLLN